MKKILVFSVLILSVLLTGCVNGKDADIYVTVYPIEYLAKEIVKDTLTVKSIYKRGQDVHDYNPTPKDLVKMSESKCIIYLGAGLEKFIEEAQNSVFKNSNVKMVELANYLNTDDTRMVQSVTIPHEHDGNHSSEYFLDPHVWMDPIRMIALAGGVLENVVSLNPTLSAEYNSNYEILIEKLTQLHQKYQDIISSDDIRHKIIMVDHDAYIYWTIRYGVDRIKLRNDNENGEVTPAIFDERVNMAKSFSIKYVISTINEAKCSFFTRYLEALDATELQLHHLGTISAKEERQGLDYISIMENNLDILIIALPKEI